MTEHSLWSRLPLLVRSNSKDSVEFILQTLWKTRKTGLDPYDRATIRGVLQLQTTPTSTQISTPQHPFSMRFPARRTTTEAAANRRRKNQKTQKLFVCLRVLIRKCVHGNCKRDEIQSLFPPEVSPELRRLLTILLQKFQREWQEDARNDKVLFNTIY